MSSEFADESSLINEPVERRVSPRGPITGLTALLPGDTEPSPVLEAGLGGVFVARTDLERFRVGDDFEITLARGPSTLTARVEVVRLEASARQGYALRVLEMSADAAATFERLRA